MPSTYSDLKIELMQTGEKNTTWGDISNVNWDAMEQAVTGAASVAFASADATVTLVDSNGLQNARSLRLVLNGTTGGTPRNLILGAGCQIQKHYIVQNNCLDTITVKNTLGTGIPVPSGVSMWLYNDGVNVNRAINSTGGAIYDNGTSVGIGTTAPVSTLHVNGGWITADNYGSPGSAIILRGAGGTKAAPTAIGPAVQQVGTFSVNAFDGANYQAMGALSFRNEGAVTSTSSPGEFVVHLTPAGAIMATPRLYVTSVGRLQTISSDIVASPANLDITQPFSISAVAAISGLTFSPSDPRLMTICVTADNYVAMRATKVALTAATDAKIITNAGSGTFNFSAAGNLGMGRIATRTGIDIWNGTNDPGYRLANASCTFDVGLLGIDAVITNLNNGHIYFATNNTTRMTVQNDGNVTFASGAYSQYLYSYGDITAAGDIHTRTIYIEGTQPAGGNFYISASATMRYINWGPAYYQSWNPADGTWQIVQNGVQRLSMLWDGGTTLAGNMTITGQLTVQNWGRFTGTGLRAGIGVTNNNIGHDYRFIAKDTGPLQITNESTGVAYLSFNHSDSNTNVFGNLYGGFSIQASGALAAVGASAAWQLANRDSATTWQYYSQGDVIRLWKSTIGDTVVTDGSTYYPITDNVMSLGWGSGRWTAVFAAGGVITTSDAREKDWRGGLNTAELALAKDLVKEVGAYRWLTEIEKEGAAAKLRIGVAAQKIIEVFERHGLDWHDYSVVNYSEWDEYTSNGPNLPAEPKLDPETGEQAVDIEGTPLFEEPVMSVVTHPAGSRYGINYSELALLIAVAQEQRLAALEALI